MQSHRRWPYGRRRQDVPEVHIEQPRRRLTLESLASKAQPVSPQSPRHLLIHPE